MEVKITSSTWAGVIHEKRSERIYRRQVSILRLLVSTSPCSPFFQSLHSFHAEDEEN